MSIYKYCSGQRFLQILNSLTIRFSPPLTFNDPFELNPYIDSIPKYKFFENGLTNGINFRRLLSMQVNDRIGILCLTRKYDNILMWSHYADSHKGAIIEFDRNHRFFQETEDYPLNLFLPVQYSNKKPTVKLSNIDKYDINFPEWNDYKRFLLDNKEILTTKSEHWKYENEWRLIRQLVPDNVIPESITLVTSSYGYRHIYQDKPYLVKKEQIISIPPEAIKSVIIGSMAPRLTAGDIALGLEEAAWRIILKNDELSHVKVRRAILDFEQFKINIFDAEESEARKKYLDDLEINIYERGYKGKAFAETCLNEKVQRYDPYNDEITKC